MKEYSCKVCGEMLNIGMVQSGILLDSVEYPAHVHCADSWSNSMMTVFKVSEEDGGSWIEENLESVMDVIRNGDDGLKYTIRKKSMKRADYESLPEFEGF